MDLVQLRFSGSRCLLQQITSVCECLIGKQSVLGPNPDFSPQTLTRLDSGTGIGYAAILAHAEGALYGTELGSVTLKRIGFFCFAIKRYTQHTH